MKILLVEDESFILDFYLSEFENELPEFDFFSAFNGLEALEVLKDETIDLIITDGKMPKMDGVQMAAEVKKLYPKTKVIMVTGYAGDYNQEDIKNAGIFQVFDKPVDFEELLNFIKNLS